VGKNIDRGKLAIKEQVTCKPVGAGTSFTIAYDMKVGGPRKLLSSLLAGSMRGETNKSLGTPKNILEVQTR
jgi:hypothetical protein